MPTPYEQEMERLRKLLADVESDEEVIPDDECFSDQENFSDHDSESEFSGSESSADPDRDDTFVGRDAKTIWQKTKFRANVRAPARNIITHLPGPKGNAKNVSDVFESWSVFIDDKMINQIVECTNIFIHDVSKNYSRLRDAKCTDSVEIKALFGLLYLAGLHKSSHLNVRDLWATDGTGIEIFRCVMSYNRFLFLMRCLRFDDVHTRDSRKQNNKLAAINEIFEAFDANCKENYTLGEYVTIDEKLEPFRGRCAFRQYMPNKPAKYGIKLFALVDARTFYTSSMEIYCGKNSNKSNKPIDVVKRLVEPLYNTGRNVTTDNWYTSYPLAKDLISKNLTIVGTLRKNKKEIPVEFVNTKKREIHSSLFGFQKDCTIVSYVPKKGKCVLLLSTMHNDDTIDEDSAEKKKPEIITFYNMTKCAVDVVDQMAASYTTARITNRWPMVVFFCILNVAAINARIILLSKKDPPVEYKNRRHFLKKLALCLVEEKKANRVVSEEPPTKKAKVSGRFRCALCPRNEDKKCQQICVLCKNYACKEHQNIVCNNCK
ncbi:piggyBac transposable element-derived protein 4-like [Uloborus diversus]|uniref:piggyBac transposable element-derived protein 4-like n=1 Tax=Uloborus diversus TaxID=327109 RepID=UPI00240947E1|nr:piggyBac transposable element-derived protein 4-like [Uloborus diversus]